MRILIVNDSLEPRTLSVVRLCRELARFLAREGNEVALLGTVRRRSEAGERRSCAASGPRSSTSTTSTPTSRSRLLRPPAVAERGCCSPPMTSCCSGAASSTATMPPPPAKRWRPEGSATGAAGVRWPPPSACVGSRARNLLVRGLGGDLPVPARALVPVVADLGGPGARGRGVEACPGAAARLSGALLRRAVQLSGFLRP